MTQRQRILTGDTPTGRLHLGHLVGSLENRVRLQAVHECYFLIANIHAFTTRAAEPKAIRRDLLEIVRDYLSVGIDPAQATFVVQSEIPAIAELTVLLAMLLPYQRVMRNPTLNHELETKGLAEHYSFGFPLYTVGQCADILAFRGQLVPVGEDQLAHIEMCREVARRFNQTYREVFPIPEALVGRVPRLVGTDGKHKMSKNLDNAIYLSDDAAAIKAKVAKLYTGRQSLDEPGDPDNALFSYVRTFMPDDAEDLAARYRKGGLGDGTIKQQVATAIDRVLAPIRDRRRASPDDTGLLELLREHTQRANAVADVTLRDAKAAMCLGL
jgi:tryptophanyl-tRNA synthetase